MESLIGMRGRFLVEGQIAAGKTTFLNKVQSQTETLGGLEVRVIHEPTKLWCKSPMGDLLAAATADPLKRFAMFQVYAQLTIRQTRQPVVQDWVSLEERSIYSSNQVFSRANPEAINTSDQFILDELQEFMTSSDQISGIFYFHVPPAVAWTRLCARGTATDSVLSLPYLVRLEEAYSRWMESNPCGGAPLLWVNGMETPDPAELLLKMQSKII